LLPNPNGPLSEHLSPRGIEECNSRVSVYVHGYKALFVYGQAIFKTPIKTCYMVSVVVK